MDDATRGYGGQQVGGGGADGADQLAGGAGVGGADQSMGGVGETGLGGISASFGGAHTGEGSDCDWDDQFDAQITVMPTPFNGLFRTESFWRSSDGNVAYFGRVIDKDKGLFAFLTTNYIPTENVFTSPIPVFAVEPATRKREMSLSDDQLMMAYHDVADVWLTVRESTAVPFGFGATLPAPVNLLGYDGEPFITRDGTSLLFVTDRLSSMDIFSVQLAAAQPAPDAIPLSVNTDYAESAPVLSADGLNLYFSRGPSPMKMWVAHRDHPDAEFVAQRALDELNQGNHGVASRFPEMISDDGCTLYFLTTIVGGYRIDSASKKR